MLWQVAVRRWTQPRIAALRTSYLCCTDSGDVCSLLKYDLDIAWLKTLLQLDLSQPCNFLGSKEESMCGCRRMRGRKRGVKISLHSLGPDSFLVVLELTCIYPVWLICLVNWTGFHRNADHVTSSTCDFGTAGEVCVVIKLPQTSWLKKEMWEIEERQVAWTLQRWVTMKWSLSLLQLGSVYHFFKLCAWTVQNLKSSIFPYLLKAHDRREAIQEVGRKKLKWPGWINPIWWFRLAVHCFDEWWWFTSPEFWGIMSGSHQVWACALTSDGHSLAHSGVLPACHDFGVEKDLSFDYWRC